MEQFNSNKLSGNDDSESAIPFDRDSSQMKVSHSPLNLGGGGAAEVPKSPVQKPVVSKPTYNKDSTNRIIGVKTFFTKLHAGAMEFQDEQITKWLQENPGIHIKLTNTTTGEIQGKKTEPNIIISVWY